MPRRRGFTLIEVTLSIVIGIILIAGATLLFNQAKIGAGNTRAKARVASLEALIEESAANAGGAYPTLASVQTEWVSKHPDDYDVSPWGGPIAAAASVVNGIGSPAGLTGMTAGPPGSGWTNLNAASAGVLVYDYLGPGVIGSNYYDVLAGASPSVPPRNYAVSIITQNGQGPGYVAGGK